MGLDTSHDCWHGPYSSFRRWRNAVARAAGYPMVANGRLGGEDYEMDWDEFTLENYMGEWDRVPGDDPLVVLLAHSDCDGVIHPAHGVHIARRLRELVPQLPEDDYRQKTERFAAGLELAAASGDDVEFR